MPKVWNKRDKDVPKDAVYVGRPSKWGNPMYLLSERDRDMVCDYYETYMTDPTHAAIRAQIRQELGGKDLVCWCAPKRCHADTLLRIANEEQ